MAKDDNFGELLKSQAHIFSQTFNLKNAASLKCAIQLRIPDVIHRHGKAMSLSELTAILPINPTKAPSISRLMRILVRAGFFAIEKEGYTLTSSGRLLLEEEPLNARALVLMRLHPDVVMPWLSLGEWFQNNDETAFHTAHGKNFWDVTAQDPRMRKMFNEGMESDSQLITKVLVHDCKFVFEGLKSLVDVGGGTGIVGKAIAETFPGMRCSVFDLPHVVANLQGTENLDYVGGDMLESIPQANAILLKWVLHDWNDENCVKILKNCKSSIPKKEDGGKLIIIDIVMETNEQEDDDDSFNAQTGLDMQMLVLFNAQERTKEDWEILFKNAGFSGYKLFPLLGTRSLIEVYP